MRYSASQRDQIYLFTSEGLEISREGLFACICSSPPVVMAEELGVSLSALGRFLSPAPDTETGGWLLGQCDDRQAAIPSHQTIGISDYSTRRIL